jgi:hypothetical protein
MSSAEYQREWRKNHPDYPAAYRASHKEELAASTKRWKDNQPPDRFRAYHKNWRDGLRVAVLVAYGGHCQCCGETEPVFLDVDHMDGRAKEGEVKLRSFKLYHWLKKNGWPKGYRLLCRNCNWGVYVRLECPHHTV